MALDLVVHSPSAEAADDVRPPTRLADLARASSDGNRTPRWLKTWSPDLHDDRIFSLWEAMSADQVRDALHEFGFLDDMDSVPMRVKEWGPADVLAAEQ